MANLLRTLVYGGQISLTLADTTAMVREAIKLHNLSRSSATVLGKSLSLMTFMSACLKGEKGEISLSVKTDGAGGDIGVSGNRRLFLRGYITDPFVEDATEKETFGTNGSLTVIRDDGYSRPFVGTCALNENGSIDEAFTEYYRISEQLPTYLKTAVEFDDKGALVFAGVVALQPLPFADKEILEKVEKTPLQALLDGAKEKGVEACAKDYFTVDETVWETREAVYKCNCSREYLTRVLVTLGKEQMHEIIKADGEIKIHCHYCNKDYQFTEEDERKIFP